MTSPNPQPVPLRHVLDNLFAFVGVLTPDGTLIEANRAPLELAGLTAADVIGKKFWDCFWWSYAPDVQAQLRDAIALALEGGLVRYDVQVRMAGDSRMWIDFQLAPLRDEAGQVTHLIPSGMDITARKQAEAALRAAHDTFSHLVQNSPFGVYVIDARFRLVQVSAGAQKVFANVRPLLNRDFAEVLRTIWQEPFASEAIGRFRHTLATGEPYHSPTTIERRRDIAEVESYDWKIERITLPDAQYGVVCHFYDLSERQRYEASLQQFIAVLAHELRNPLAPIRTSVALMRTREQADELLIKCRDVIDRQVAHMARLLDDLLDVSRLSRGRLTLQLGNVTLAEVLDSAVETSRPVIDQQNCRLTVERPSADIRIHGDAARLAQVFANLLNNAAKYNRPGGEIAVSVTPEDRGVAVTVADTGIGLSREFLTEAFELFTQDADASDRTTGGLGIGLALARQLVELHGGTITATSAGRDQGSQFRVWLPTLTDSDRSQTPHGPTHELPRLTLRIVVAEDNIDSAEMLHALLGSLGCDVVTVNDGAQAVQQIEQIRPDVALLDIGLPVLDGYEVCRRVRSFPWGAGIKMVALTGWG